MTDSLREPSFREDGATPSAATFSSITPDPIDPAAIEAFVMAAEQGALVTFRGIVRNHDHGLTVTSLEYQAHPDADRFLEECCRTIAAETGLAVAAAHRVGWLVVGETALVAAVAAPHRAEAFAACEKLVNLIKQNVPIWKRQHLADGATEWVGL
jgi:molybdopterin synthase catalytic subunit